MKFTTATLGLFSTVLVSLLPRESRAEMGSVHVTAVTRSSITIEIAEPGRNHRLAPEGASFKICVREAGSSRAFCLPESPVIASRSYTIGGLDPATAYEIRVEARAEKQIAPGEWSNGWYRHVATIRQSTLGRSTLRFAGVSRSVLEVELSNPDFGTFQVVRFAYKRRWNVDQDLHEVVREGDGPRRQWLESTVYCGWRDVLSSGPTLRVAFESLASFTTYEVVAYGFRIDVDEGVFLGSLMATTAGSAPMATVEDAVVTDHHSVAYQYLDRLASLRPIEFPALVDELMTIDSELAEDKEKLMADEGYDLGVDFNAFEYVVKRKPGVFARWQANETFKPAGLTLER
jgi:hypothetical protein